MVGLAGNVGVTWRYMGKVANGAAKTFHSATGKLLEAPIMNGGALAAVKALRAERNYSELITAFHEARSRSLESVCA